MLKTVSGTPGGIRTPDHVVRTDVLYPTELRAQLYSYFINSILKTQFINKNRGSKLVNILDYDFQCHRAIVYHL